MLACAPPYLMLAFQQKPFAAIKSQEKLGNTLRSMVADSTQSTAVLSFLSALLGVLSGFWGSHGQILPAWPILIVLAS